MRKVAALALASSLALSPSARGQNTNLPLLDAVDEAGNPIKVLDWSRISWDSFDAVREGGSFDFVAEVSNHLPPETVNQVLAELGYDPSRIWQAGDKLPDILMMGDLQEWLAPHQLSMGEIISRAGVDIEAFSVLDVGFVEAETVGDFINSFNLEPNFSSFNRRMRERFEEMPVSTIPALDNLVNGEGIGGAIGGLFNRNEDAVSTVGEALSEVGGLDLETAFGAESLSSLGSLLSIPIGNTSSEWRQAVLSEIPGLDQLPLSDFPLPMGLSGGGVVGYLDLPLGEKEAHRMRTVSGSNQDGYGVPCDQSSCPHIELNGVPGIEGMQWISGEVQEVNGGHGILGALNGGKEETGRNPFGSIFKVVLDEVNESEGSADFEVFFRFCKRITFVDLGCTPYFIGPFPWFSAREKELVILGMGGFGSNNRGYEVDPQILGDVGGEDSPSSDGEGEIPELEPTPTPTPVASVGCGRGNMGYPLPSRKPVTSEYGMRFHPTLQVYRIHAGIDLGNVGYTTPVISACDGVVNYVRNSGGAGLHISINHGNNIHTRYLHLSENRVSDGETVTRGQQIGITGSSGIGTGPHLHFETYEGGFDSHVNPREFIEF